MPNNNKNKAYNKAYHDKYYRENREQILKRMRYKSGAKRDRLGINKVKLNEQVRKEIDELRKRCGMRPLSELPPDRRLYD